MDEKSRKHPSRVPECETSRGKRRPVRSARRKKPKLTRDWLLLVRDQDILDFTNSIPIDRMREFAGRFTAIAYIIRPNPAWVSADSVCATAGLANSTAASSDAGGPSGAEDSTGAEKTRAPDETLDQKIRKIERIERESRVKGFRLIVSAIKQGLATGRDWYAYNTALAVVAELFHHTGGYFRAFDEFCASVLAKRKR